MESKLYIGPAVKLKGLTKELFKEYLEFGMKKKELENRKVRIVYSEESPYVGENEVCIVQDMRIGDYKVLSESFVSTASESFRAANLGIINDIIFWFANRTIMKQVQKGKSKEAVNAAVIINPEFSVIATTTITPNKEEQ